MADNLIFPIKFDLEKGVKDALADGDKALDRIAKALEKHPITIKLRMDNRVARGGASELVGFRKQLAELTQQWNALTAAERGSAAGAAIREKFRALRTEAQGYTSTLQAAVKAEDKLRETQSKSTSISQKLPSAYHEQSTYLSRLIQRMAAYAGVSYVGSFLTNVREVTAQFELQRISLGAIIQDQARANQLFEEIKTFALKSPVKILDLTKYTKQLAAYKIGVDELFDTTKRLTDISVGLGVSMDRVVLAYGQIRATGHLRASEAKQLTEMGVPIVEELADKLSKMNGELVSAAEVMDMMSKRAISFELVKEVFDDMTSAGGTFYNMQEKQGNTLYGLWAKLGDAASVMYEQIGNTGVVNEGMKEAIQMLTELMRNWKAVGLTAATSILPAVAAMAAWKMATKALAKSVATATNERIVAEAKLATAMKGTDVAAQNAARSSLAKAKADEAAAIAAQKNATAQSRLKMGFVSLGKTIASGLGIGIAVMLVTNLIYKFYEALTNFRKLKRELGSIYTETATLQDQSVRNFEFLADKAVKAANGSKEQTDALQELNRTYRDILPQEALTIENLTKLKGNYDALTQSIKEYIAEQQRQKAESSIFEYYGTKIRDAQNDVRERLYDQGLSATEVGRFFAEFGKAAPKYGEDVWGAFRESMIAAGVKDKKRIAQIWKKEFRFTQRDIVSSDTGNANIRALSEAYADQANELKGMNEQYRESIGNLGKFADMQKRVSDTVANATYKTTGDKPIDTDKQGDLLEAMKFNLWVKQTAAEIQNSEDIKKAFAFMGEGIKSEWFNIIDTINSNDLGKVSQINFDAIIASVDKMIADLGKKNPEILTILNTFRNYLVSQKKQYENMAPSETVIVRWRNRWRAIVSELKISGQNMNRFLMQSSEDFEAYRKRIKEEVTAVINQINILNEAIKARISARAAGDDKYTKEQEAADKKKLKQAEERKKALQKLLEDLDKIDIETGKKDKGSKSDTRLQVLQEVAQTLSIINKEYDDLAKKEGASKALADIKERFKDVLTYTNKIGGKFGLNFGLPTEFKTLQEYRNAILNVMQSLKGLPKGSEKTILDFKTMIGKADSDYLQKQIESELKRLADRISRTKTAKEFYEKILSTTGNVDMAINLTTSIFGENGEDLNKQIALQINELMQSGEGGIEIGLDVVGDGYNINYKNLRKLTEEAYKAKKIGDQAYKDLIAIANNGEKDVSKMVDGWLKATEKAKSYSDKLLDLARTTNAEIAKIEAQRTAGNITDDYAEAQIQGYKDKQAQEIAKLQYEAFKDSPMYVQMFDDLDNASGTMLRNMKKRIEELKTSWKDLTPTQLKEMQSRLNEIDAQLAKRNPFKGLIDGIKEYRKLRGKGDALGNKSEGAAERTLDAAAKARLEAEKEYLEILQKEGATQQEITDAKRRFDDAAADEDAAAKALENWKKVKDAIGLSANELFQMLNWAGDIAKGIADISEAMGADEEDVQYWNDVADALGQISGGIQDIVSAAMSGNVVGIISSTLTAIPKMFVGFTNLFSAGKIKRANKEIKRQQELLDQLEYTYGRLEKAADKAFGADFVANQKQQQKILLAQQQAYMKQYEAEMSKGKKADKEKAQEFLDKARDVGDQIADMQGKIAERMLGTDLTSAARDFANAWLEAYKEFGNTADAMSEKFHEMIQNMIVESLLAKVMERALKPAFDMIDNMNEEDFYSESFWKKVMATAEQGAKDADHGAGVVMKWIEKMGYDMREMGSEYSGIAKEVSSASSEEINQLSAFVNTALYYVSPIPTISENVFLIRQLMERGTTSTLPDTTAAGWTDWQQQAMDNYIAIQRNTADTVVECRRAANACEAATEKLNRIIVAKGGKFAVNTTYV